MCTSQDSMLQGSKAARSLQHCGDTPSIQMMLCLGHLRLSCSKCFVCNSCLNQETLRVLRGPLNVSNKGPIVGAVGQSMLKKSSYMGKWFNLVTCLEFPSSKQRNDDGFQIAAVCRTKQWMASKEYSETLLLYPRYLALDRLPLGLPSGVSSSANGLEKSTLAHQKFSFEICACFLLLTCWQMKIIAIPHIKWFLSTWIQFPICPPHAGIADKREISIDQRKHLEKFLPAFRFQLFALERTADFLESWLDGT